MRYWLHCYIHSKPFSLRVSSTSIASARMLIGFTGIHTVLTSFKSIGGIHCDAANNVVAHMLSNLNNKTGTCVVDFDCVVQLRKVAFLESYINDRAANLNNFSYIAHEFVFLLNYLRSL